MCPNPRQELFNVVGSKVTIISSNPRMMIINTPQMNAGVGRTSSDPRVAIKDAHKGNMGVNTSKADA